jgi:hypothetical protein
VPDNGHRADALPLPHPERSGLKERSDAMHFNNHYINQDAFHWHAAIAPGSVPIGGSLENEQEPTRKATARAWRFMPTHKP